MQPGAQQPYVSLLVCWPRVQWRQLAHAQQLCACCCVRNLAVCAGCWLCAAVWLHRLQSVHRLLPLAVDTRCATHFVLVHLPHCSLRPAKSASVAASEAADSDLCSLQVNEDK